MRGSGASFFAFFTNPETVMNYRSWQNLEASRPLLPESSDKEDGLFESAHVSTFPFRCRSIPLQSKYPHAPAIPPRPMALSSQDPPPEDQTSRNPSPQDRFLQEQSRPGNPESWRPSALVRASMVLHGAALTGAALSPARWPLFLKTVAANHLALGIAGISPRSSWLGPALCRLPVTPGPEPSVALTFDDGPDPKTTPQVLDLLDEYQARASFFLIGRRAEQFPDLAREIVRRGHLVENHTHHHRHTFAFKLYPGMRREILQAQETLEELAGRRPRYFRAPAGMRNIFLDPILHDLNLRLVAWTRRGYDAVDSDADRILPRLSRGLAAGDILLLHDGNSPVQAERGPVIEETLPRLLDLLARRGLVARPLPDEPQSLTAETA